MTTVPSLTETQTSEIDLGEQEPCAKWMELEEKFPMETLEQFEAFNLALKRNPRVSIIYKIIICKSQKCVLFEFVWYHRIECCAAAVRKKYKLCLDPGRIQTLDQVAQGRKEYRL